MIPRSLFNRNPSIEASIAQIERDILLLTQILEENKIRKESEFFNYTQKGSLIGPKVDALLSHLGLELKKGDDYVLTKVNELK